MTKLSSTVVLPSMRTPCCAWCASHHCFTINMQVHPKDPTSASWFACPEHAKLKTCPSCHAHIADCRCTAVALLSFSNSFGVWVPVTGTGVRPLPRPDELCSQCNHQRIHHARNMRSKCFMDLCTCGGFEGTPASVAVATAKAAVDNAVRELAKVFSNALQDAIKSRGDGDW